MLQNQLTKVLTRLVVASVTVLSVSAAVQQPSYASSYSFDCKMTSYGGKRVPATFAQNDDGRKIMIVRWVSGYFSSKLSNIDRCNIVSRRFQLFHDHSKLVFIKGGYVRNLPVVCAVKNENDGCNKYNVLYTLKPDKNPYNTARSLMNRRGLAAGIILNESSSDSLMIDFNAFLENASGSGNSE